MEVMENKSNTTAMIIASQNQDYVDEGLAEYQDQIHKLQNEQDRVQKKTFVNWINSHLSRRNPALKIHDLIEDLKSGVVLLTLLEVLSGSKLQEERGRILKRPHFLSNCNTALEFLRTRKIKLVNINASDIVDGRPPVILGLIWTIILYFQIEENTKQMYADSQGQHSSAVSDPRRRSSGWKVGARNALLQWCKEIITPKFGIHVENFGSSWRDGRAFVALISALNPDLFVKLEDFEGLLTLHALQGKSNQSRLKIAFLIAEKEFGIYPLLDPEDVDVSNPDEKSIMTYVAQFLNKFSSKDSSANASSAAAASSTSTTTTTQQKSHNEYHRTTKSEKKTDRCASVAYTSTQVVHQPLPKRPSSSKSHQNTNLPMASKIEQLRAWLTTTNQFFESINLKKDQRRLSYTDYLQFRKELQTQEPFYSKLKSQFEEKSLGEYTHSWKDIDTNWQKVETQLRHLLWILDTALPGELGIIGEWVNQGEAFLMSDDEPAQYNEDSAALLNQKIEDHKQFFENYDRTMEQLKQWTSSSSKEVNSPEQLKSLTSRLHKIGPKACQRGFHLKFLEHKCCILAFLNLTENKLRSWTRKCGNEDNVSHVLQQYKAFVSKNKIFQEFHKAFLEFKDVSEDYKNNANLPLNERSEIDNFIADVQGKWSVISTELQHVQVHLNEVLSNWQQWNSSYNAMESYLNEAFERFEGDEANIQLFLQDLDQWKMHYTLLQTTSTFLMDACDENIASNLQQKMAVIHCNWSYLLQYAEKYGSAETLNRASFDEELKQLDSWLTRAQSSLEYTRKFNSQEVSEAFNEITEVNAEVSEMETLFKSLSRRFQALVSEMGMPEIEDTMKILKSQKEHLVHVRSVLPVRQNELGETVKKVGEMETQMRKLENEVLHMQVVHLDSSESRRLESMEEMKQSLSEFAEKGFDVSEMECELSHIQRQVMEYISISKSANREQILMEKFEEWCSELEQLCADSSSNLLQIMVLQLNLIILSRQLKKEKHILVKEQLSKTLKYIQEASQKMEKIDQCSDSKLSTDLKILAHSDLERILPCISSTEKENILAMLDILLNLTHECSGDIASTYTNLSSLRDKILSIKTEDANEDFETDDEEEDEDEMTDPVVEETKAQLAKDTTTICSELQEFHGSIDTFLKNSDTITLQDIESLALQEDALSTKVRELKQKREILDEHIQVSLNEAISIIEQSLEAVRKKMYGDFGDHKTLTTTAQKVQQMKEIVEGQLKEASEQMNKSEAEFESTEVMTHLEESLQTGEEDIVFAQNKLKSRTTSLCKEGLAFEFSALKHYIQDVLAFIRCILHPSKNPQDLESKLKRIVGKYENYEGWKILTTACSTYLVSKNSLPEASVLLKLLKVDFNLGDHDLIRPFEDLDQMKNWLDEHQNQNQGNNLEERLANAVQKSKKEKITKIVTSLTTILDKLQLAENNPLSLDRRSIQAISDLSGKLANLKSFFQQPFLDSLLERHANLVEIFEIKIAAENKLQLKNSGQNLVERKMSFYSSIKDAIEKKNLKNEGLSKTLAGKIEALTSANNIVLWAEEALSGIKAILRVDVKHLIDDKDGVLAEAANWKTQASTRLLNLEEIQNLSKDTLDFVKDQLRKVLELAASIDQKIEDTADTEKEAKIQAFQAKEQLIANQLQNILLALQGIKIEGSSLTAIEKASQNVEKILDDCEKLEAEKNAYVELGNVVKDYHKSVDSIKDICNKWERVTNLLRDQKIKSQSLIQMWNTSENLKSSFEMDMNKFEETFPKDQSDSEIQDLQTLSSIQEEYKSSIDVLRKMRHNFEAFFKCQKQLIHEMQTVPSFDTSHLKKELADLQQRYAELCTNQKEKLFHVNKCLTTWNNVQKEMDLLEDLKQSLTNPNCQLLKIIGELSNLSQHAEKVVESLETEVLPKVNLKVIFMQNTLNCYKKKIALFLQDSANQEIIEELLKTTQTIEKSVAQLQHQKSQNYNDFKSHLQMLNSLKELIEKISGLKTLETNTTLESFTRIFLNKCEENVKELMNDLKSVQDLDLNESEAENVAGDLNMLKSILNAEVNLFEAYFGLLAKPETQTNIHDLKVVFDVIDNLETIVANIKTAKVSQVNELKEKLENISSNWKPILLQKVDKIRQIIEENIEKEENSEMRKMLQSLENDIIESELMRDNVKKYGKLSAISWKFPRQSEVEESSMNTEKMHGLFNKIVGIMQADLDKSLTNISEENSWLKSWLQASIDEMCLNEPFTDITQVVQCLDQTLILLNSSNYAQLCLRNHRNWNGKIHQIKSLLLQETDDFTWLEKIAKAESGLNELFDQASTKPVQPEDVVLLSTIDEMCNKLDKLMNDYRNFLAQLRYFEEKAQELKITLENSNQELDLISSQEKDLCKNLMNINALASQLELCHLLKHINELMLEIQKLIADKKSSDEIIEKIVNRTEELKELGIEDEDFESKATNLLQDLNDVNVKLTEQQNEQIQSCLDEVTSLLEEFELATNLNADMCEIAQLHEELTNWLKDVEDALQKSLDLKSSLEEKKKQLEEYHEIHNDIEAHEKLVSMVFEKTSKLMTQTNDFSLSAYLTSIQSLFETIKQKSWKLIQQMGECIQEQEEYEERLVNFTDFLTAQAQYLKEILSVKSHHPGFDPQAELNMLLQRIEDGNSMLLDLEDTLADVVASTSDEGKEGLENEFQQISLMWTKHLKQIQDLKGSLSVQTSALF